MLKLLFTFSIDTNTRTSMSPIHMLSLLALKSPYINDEKWLFLALSFPYNPWHVWPLALGPSLAYENNNVAVY